MSKTVLFVASVTKKHIIQFHLPYMKWFKDHGYKVHVCAGDDFEPEEARYIPYCDEYYIVPFYRSPFATQNFRSYKELRKLIKKKTSTSLCIATRPVAAAIARYAFRTARKSTTQGALYRSRLSFLQGRT